MHVAHMCQGEHVSGHRKTWRNQLCPFTMLVLGTKLKLLSLVASTSTY